MEQSYYNAIKRGVHEMLGHYVEMSGDKNLSILLQSCGPAPENMKQMRRELLLSVKNIGLILELVNKRHDESAIDQALVRVIDEFVSEAKLTS